MQPIGWGALGALSADPRDDNRLYTATDIAYGPARILGVDVAQKPALIDTELPITEDGKPVTLDTEGISARPDGGFVLAVEGEDGPGNELVYVDGTGKIESACRCPKTLRRSSAARGSKALPVDGELGLGGAAA